jgi:hypothetical protein
MSHMSRRPGTWSSRACLAAAVGALALPLSVRGQANDVAVVARSWTLAGCGHGEVVSRPTLFGNVICLTGLALWGQNSAGDWRLTLDTRETPHPSLALSPGLDGISSFAYFRFTGPGCSGVCSDQSDLFVQSTRGPGSKAVAFQPSILFDLGRLDPASLQLTRLGLFYRYRPGESEGDPSEFGVLVDVTPRLVPEPGLAVLTVSGLGLLGLATAWRTRRRSAQGNELNV